MAVHFRGNRVAEHLFEGFAPLQAVRALGALSPEKLREGGLTNSDDSLTIESSRGQSRLILGSMTVAGEGRRALETSSRMVYVISLDQLPQPGLAATSLFETSLHDFKYTDASSMVIAFAGVKAEAIQFYRDSIKRSYWRWKWQDDIEDGILSNWLDSLHMIRATAPASPGFGEPIISLAYQNKDKQLGYLKIWRVPDGDGHFSFVGASEQSVGAMRLGTPIQNVMEDLPRVMATALHDARR
jgi:hypothetical protein